MSALHTIMSFSAVKVCIYSVSLLAGSDGGESGSSCDFIVRAAAYS